MWYESFYTYVSTDGAHSSSWHFFIALWIMVLLLATLLNTMSISVIFSSSPLTLGVWVILISLLITLFLCSLTTSWFTFLIFLIYIGGLLVIFSYFVAIQPNQHLGMLKMIAMSVVSRFYLYSLSAPIIRLPHRLSLLTPSLRIVISSPTIFIIILMAISLFLALIVVVKITYSTKAPLRPYSSYVQTYSKISPTV